MTGYPEPPAVGEEAETLIGSLERQRATFAYKCADLGAEQLRQTFGSATVTLAGLLKHLAYMEDLNFTVTLAGQPLPSPWAELDPEGRGDQVWESALEDEPAELYRLWDEAVDRSRAATQDAVRRGGLAVTFDVGASTCSLRRLLVDLIEEYARHTGHADLLRESIDGRVGEDPPGRPYAYTLG